MMSYEHPIAIKLRAAINLASKQLDVAVPQGYVTVPQGYVLCALDAWERYETENAILRAALCPWCKVITPMSTK